MVKRSMNLFFVDDEFAFATFSAFGNTMLVELEDGRVLTVEHAKLKKK